MEPHEAEMDRLLRRSLAMPVPTLSPNFDQRVLRAVRHNSQSLGRYCWMLFTGYGIFSAVTSVVVMRGVGLDWIPIGAILTPLALAAGAYAARRAKNATTKREIVA